MAVSKSGAPAPLFLETGAGDTDRQLPFPYSPAKVVTALSPISIYFAICHFALWLGQFVFQQESIYQFHARARSGKKGRSLVVRVYFATFVPRFHPSWCKSQFA